MPDHVPKLKAHAKPNVFEPILHSSLNLLYTHLDPRVGILCFLSIAIPATVFPCSAGGLTKIEFW